MHKVFSFTANIRKLPIVHLRTHKYAGTRVPALDKIKTYTHPYKYERSSGEGAN